MIIRKRWFERWKSDHAFKTVVTAFASLLVTVLFALYNGFLGIYHGSVWYGAICLYYLLLALLRGSVIAAEKKLSDRGGDERSRDRAHLAASVLLLILNISMIGPITMMVVLHKTGGYDADPRDRHGRLYDIQDHDGVRPSQKEQECREQPRQAAEDHQFHRCPGLDPHAAEYSDHGHLKR